jgi:hypothetical protein
MIIKVTSGREYTYCNKVLVKPVTDKSLIERVSIAPRPVQTPISEIIVIVIYLHKLWKNGSPP